MEEVEGLNDQEKLKFNFSTQFLSAIDWNEDNVAKSVTNHC